MQSSLAKSTQYIYIIIMSYIRFAWDDKKNQASVRKHGVYFEEAQTAFFDANARIIHDPDHSREDNHFLLPGISRKLRLLTVCHCYRQNDEIIRVISARKATKNEAKQYRSYKK